jgi:hypothetical protein
MFQATPLNCSRPRSCVTKINNNKHNMCLRLSSLFICVVLYRGKRNVSGYQREVTRSRNSKDIQHNGQKDKQRSTKHYTEN